MIDNQLVVNLKINLFLVQINIRPLFLMLVILLLLLNLIFILGFKALKIVCFLIFVMVTALEITKISGAPYAVLPISDLAQVLIKSNRLVI